MALRINAALEAAPSFRPAHHGHTVSGRAEHSRGVLDKRNEFLISSHHPLRETIMQQTGMTEAARREFLTMVDKRAIDALIHRWSTPEMAPATF